MASEPQPILSCPHSPCHMTEALLWAVAARSGRAPVVQGSAPGEEAENQGGGGSDPPCTSLLTGWSFHIGRCALRRLGATSPPTSQHLLMEESCPRLCEWQLSSSAPRALTFYLVPRIEKSVPEGTVKIKSDLGGRQLRGGWGLQDTNSKKQNGSPV